MQCGHGIGGAEQDGEVHALGPFFSKRNMNKIYSNCIAFFFLKAQVSNHNSALCHFVEILSRSSYNPCSAREGHIMSPGLRSDSCARCWNSAKHAEVAAETQLRSSYPCWRWPVGRALWTSSSVHLADGFGGKDVFRTFKLNRLKRNEKWRLMKKCGRHTAYQVPTNKDQMNLINKNWSVKGLFKPWFTMCLYLIHSFVWREAVYWNHWTLAFVEAGKSIRSKAASKAAGWAVAEEVLAAQVAKCRGKLRGFRFGPWSVGGWSSKKIGGIIKGWRDSKIQQKNPIEFVKLFWAKCWNQGFLFVIVVSTHLHLSTFFDRKGCLLKTMGIHGSLPNCASKKKSPDKSLGKLLVSTNSFHLFGWRLQIENTFKKYHHFPTPCGSSPVLSLEGVSFCQKKTGGNVKGQLEGNSEDFQWPKDFLKVCCKGFVSLS